MRIGSGSDSSDVRKPGFSLFYISTDDAIKGESSATEAPLSYPDKSHPYQNNEQKKIQINLFLNGLVFELWKLSNHEVTDDCGIECWLTKLLPPNFDN